MRLPVLAVLSILGTACAGAASASDVSSPPKVPGAPPPAPLWTSAECPPWMPPCDDPRRGPCEVRDGHVFAQPRLTLTAISPDTLGCGRTSVRASFLWSTMFGANQDVPGENDSPRRYRVDAETQTIDLTVRHGFGEDLDLGVRVPVHGRGAGVLDGFINWFHALAPDTFLDNGRTDYDDDRYRVNGTNADGSTFSWDDRDGYGVGDVELEGRWRFANGCRDGWSAALVGRLGLPTGTDPYDVGGVSAGIQVVAAKRFARDFDLFVGGGGTAWTEDEIDGVRYESLRGHGFVAVEWRPGHAWSLVAEFEAATPLTKGIASPFGERHLYVNVDAKIDLSASTTLELGFTENVPTHQESNTDFAIHVGLVVGF